MDKMQITELVATVALIAACTGQVAEEHASLQIAFLSFRGTCTNAAAEWQRKYDEKSIQVSLACTDCNICGCGG